MRIVKRLSLNSIFYQISYNKLKMDFNQVYAKLNTAQKEVVDEN